MVFLTKNCEGDQILEEWVGGTFGRHEGEAKCVESFVFRAEVKSVWKT
jgi:hypothetical protein